MLILFSHILAFSVLFVAGVFDIYTSEVPDSISLLGVVGGILLHLGASVQQGINFSTLADLSVLISDPVNWLGALGDPLLWSLGVGTAFSVYGWGLYLSGMWGGADAFAMSILGFATPYGISGPEMIYPVNLFVSVLLAGFIYTLAYAFYQSLVHREVWRVTLERLEEQEKRIAIEILGGALLALMGSIYGTFNSLIYFIFFLLMIFLYRFLMAIQDEVMRREMKTEQLEGGEVVHSNETVNRIKGIEEEEIEEIPDETVEVRSGVRFVPVFSIGLVLTDVFGMGIEFIVLLLN